MSTATPPLALTMGDPAGCAPQITLAAWASRNVHDFDPFFVIGDPRLYEDGQPVACIQTPEDAQHVFDDALPVLPLEIDGFDDLQVGTPLPASAPAIIASIHQGTDLCLAGQASGLVTNPISKAVLYDSGFSYPGHTEFIAATCARAAAKPLTPVMMLVGGGLRVALATIHVPLMSVLEHLTPRSLTDIATLTDKALRQDFGLSSPRLAFTGLNPHAGEDGSIGTEEQDLINPVAAILRADGIDVSDARPADTVFHEALTGQFDAVIAMTHDQGLIPVKTLDIWGGVNTTLGLPIIRTSPDHGTAYDVAAKGSARSDSLVAAIKLASEMVAHRKAANV